MQRCRHRQSAATSGHPSCQKIAPPTTGFRVQPPLADGCSNGPVLQSSRSRPCCPDRHPMQAVRPQFDQPNRCHPLRSFDSLGHCELNPSLVFRCQASLVPSVFVMSCVGPDSLSHNRAALSACCLVLPGCDGLVPRRVHAHSADRPASAASHAVRRGRFHSSGPSLPAANGPFDGAFGLRALVPAFGASICTRRFVSNACFALAPAACCAERAAASSTWVRRRSPSFDERSIQVRSA